MTDEKQDNRPTTTERDVPFVIEDVPELERSTMYVRSFDFDPPVCHERFFMPKNKFAACIAAMQQTPFTDEFSIELDAAIAYGADEFQFELERETLNRLIPEWPRYIVRSTVWNRDAKWYRAYWLEGGPRYDRTGARTKEEVATG